VLTDRHDARIDLVISLGGNLPPQSFHVRPLEVAERFRAGAADAGILRLFLLDVGFALRLDARQFKLIAQDGREIIQGNFACEDVLAGVPAGLAGAFFLFAGAKRRADFAVTLSDAAGAVLAVAKVRNVQLRDGDTDQVPPLAADHLALRDVLPEVLPDFA